MTPRTEILSPVSQSRPVLSARAMTYRYPQNGHGLPETNLESWAGEFWLVRGASGSGKSTLARCLTGLIPHLYRGEFHGDVVVDGLNTRTSPIWMLSERAGLVFQNPAAQMLASSVEEELIFGLENLGLPAGEITGRVRSMFDRFGLVDFRRRSPLSLSGGEQQKLALAAVMARLPGVLVLDEPLSMLDSTAATELVSHLEALAEMGTAVIVCEHRHEYLDGVRGLHYLDLPSPANSPVDAAQTEVPCFEEIDHPFRMDVDDLCVDLGRRRVVQHLSFCAHGGEVIAVVGRNGVGKTTLLRVLAGLQSFTGRVCVDDGADIRPDFGIVYQNADLQLFNASVREEILYRLPRPDLQLYRQLIIAMGLERYEDAPPLLLSEGEKKRVALATVLMRRPRHGVLLDEPSLGQDSRHKEILLRTARALARAGRCVMITTHDLSLAAGTDRIVLLGAEGIEADGPSATVLDDAGAWMRCGLVMPRWVRGVGGGMTGRSAS